MLEQLVYIFIGIMIGGISIYFVRTYQLKSNFGLNREDADHLTRQLSEAQSQIAIIQDRNNNLIKQLEESRNEFRTVDTENRRLLEETTSLREKNIYFAEKLEEQKKDLEQVHNLFKDQFKVLANEILEEKTNKFTQQNQINIKQILDPLGERIKEFNKKVEDTYNLEMKERITLQEQIKGLTELNHKMSEEANNLTKALKGDTKLQGNWGEFILERILEISGLQKDREYRVQVSGSNDQGRKIQPDVIIDLPDQRHLVIDSKVSLTAFERYSSAENDLERDAALKEHVLSIRSHVKGLSDKNYQTMYGINTPDFVLMFIPIEPAFGSAIQNDPSIYNEAIERNIVLVSPTTLLAVLKTISSMWKQEHRTRNAMEIAEQGGRMFDKLVLLAEDLVGIGNRLQQTQAVYDQAMNKLQTGRGNLMGRAKKLQELGVKTTKSLPAEFRDDFEDDED
jgi:DNA recombination protein RmuC